MAIRLSVLALLVWACWPGGPRADEALSKETVHALVREVLAPEPLVRQQALQVLQDRGELDVVPGLIQAMRFVKDGADIDKTLAVLTGEPPGKTWLEWVLWQRAHPEIAPYEGFDEFKADVMAAIDPRFREFLKPGVAHAIRLEEVVWDGVSRHGVPALTNPKEISAVDASYLTSDELVFGVEINGDARAYPLRILDRHEILNDVIGGAAVTLAYSPLCGSGILYDSRVADRTQPFLFASSGLLYRFDMLMYDKATHSLWVQFTGRPVVGPLTGSGIKLKMLPVTITSWHDWQAAHPKTKVLSLQAGFDRDHTPGKQYGDDLAIDQLKFPGLALDHRLPPKAYVFALRAEGHQRAWPLDRFKEARVINDRVGDLGVVLIGDAATLTVRAYRSDGRTFEAGPDAMTLRAHGQEWRIEEAALVGPDGQRLDRLPGHIAYWFAWQTFIEGAPLAEARTSNLP